MKHLNLLECFLGILLTRMIFGVSVDYFAICKHWSRSALWCYFSYIFNKDFCWFGYKCSSCILFRCLCSVRKLKQKVLLDQCCLRRFPISRSQKNQLVFLWRLVLRGNLERMNSVGRATMTSGTLGSAFNASLIWRTPFHVFSILRVKVRFFIIGTGF